MRNAKRICLFIVVCMLVQTLLPITVLAASENADVYMIRIVSEDRTVSLSDIVVDVYEEILDTSETVKKMKKYDDVFSFSKRTDTNGRIVFERPSQIFSFDVDLSSLPEGYGVSEKSAFVQDDRNLYEIKLSGIASERYDEETSEYRCFDEDGNLIFSQDRNGTQRSGRESERCDVQGESARDEACCIRYSSDAEVLRTDPPISARTDHFLVKIDETGIQPSEYSYYIPFAQCIADAFEEIDELLCEDNDFLRPTSVQYSDAYYVQVVSDSAVNGNRAETHLSTFSTDTDIRLNSDIHNYVNTSTGSITNSWLGVLAHEYMHAIMHKYYITDVWMQESFAKACGFLYDSTYINYMNSNEYVNAIQIQSYIETSDQPMTNNNNNDIILERCYGSSVFPLYIFENLGGYETIKDIFERCSVYNGQLFTLPTTAIKQAINNYGTYDATRYKRSFAEFSTYLYDVSAFYNVLSNSIQAFNPHYVPVVSYPQTSASDIPPLASKIYTYKNFSAPALTHPELIMKITQTVSGDALPAYSTLQKDIYSNYTVVGHNLSSNSHIIVEDFGTNDCTSVSLVLANAGVNDDASVSVYAKVNYAPQNGMRYSIKNVGSGLFLGCYYTTPGSNIYQYAQSNYADQDFLLSTNSNYPGGYRIYMTNITSNYIDVQQSGGLPYDGANVFINSVRIPAAQYWTFTLDTQTGYYIISPYVSSTLALTAYGNSAGTNTGTSPTSPGNIFVSTYVSNNNYQLWELVPVSTS